MAVAIGVAACNPAAEISAPVMTLADIEFRAFSGGTANLSLVLTVDNQNSFEITLVEIAGALTLDEIPVGEVRWSGEIRCPKQDTTTVRIPVHLVVVGEGSDIFRDLIDRRPMVQTLRGEATIARGVITRSFSINLSRDSGREGR
jgi:LEA14-like dessication related protein